MVENVFHRFQRTIIVILFRSKYPMRETRHQYLKIDKQIMITFCTLTFLLTQSAYVNAKAARKMRWQNWKKKKSIGVFCICDLGFLFQFFFFISFSIFFFYLLVYHMPAYKYYIQTTHYIHSQTHRIGRYSVLYVISIYIQYISINDLD